MQHALRRLRADPADPDALMVLGAWHIIHGNVRDALGYFNRVTRTNPAYSGIWRLKAKAFEALGDQQNAERCRLLGRDPDS